MRTKIIVSFLVVLVMLTIFPGVTKTASAHITKAFGNYLIEVGWVNEPALTGQMNEALVVVVKGSHIDTGQPVINALANMQISVKYGTITKPLDFLPSKTADGQYVGSLIPTRVGSYSLVMKGTIEGQAIDTEIPLDDVANVNTLYFPQTGTSGTDNIDISNISSKLEGMVTQLANDIDAVRQSTNATLQLVAQDQKSIQDAKGASDRAYMIAMTAMGVGAAGIVIAALSITRKGKI